MNKKRRKQIEALAAIALFLLVLGRWQRSWNYVWAAAAIFLLGLLWKDFAEMLRAGWMKLAEGLGFVSGKIILTVVYFLVLIPIAIFARRSGKLNIRLNPDGRMGFKVRNHRYAKEDLENPW
ncbi:MAG TPA: SxtJ family membrane protein [Puia sp.]|nr:SxtJ family membrane protein [Puia sp.]